MNKKLLLAAAASVALAGPASASLFLDDWGVSYDNWNPVDFDGSATYVVEDFKPGDNPTGWLDPGYGGQNFDVEAMYFGVDDTSYYMAVVTGFRPEGRQGFEAGDIFFDANNDGTYDYAFDTSEDGEMVSGITAVEYSDAGGGESWGGVSDPFRVLTYSGAPVADLAWSYAAFDGRYAIEVVIDKGYFGSLTEVAVHWTMGCGNDAGDLVATVPEPATLLLFGVGLVGVAGRQIRRRRRS